MTVQRPAFFLTVLGLGLGLLAGCTSDASETNSARKAQLPESGMTPGTQSMPVDEPTPVPDLTLTTMSGETIELAQQSGKVLLLNFWATWCAPCRKEIPDLVDLQKELGPKGLTIIGIALDREGADVVKPYAKEHTINYPLVLDPDTSIPKHFGEVYGLPTTFVVGPDGQIRHRILGILPIDQLKPKLVDMLEST